MYELFMFDILMTVTKAQDRFQGHRIIIGALILGFLWYLMMLWITYLSDEIDIEGAEYTSRERREREKKLKAKAKQSDADDAKKKQHEQDKIVEPYDTKAFLKDPSNFDIDEFWNSYTHQDKKK